MQHDAPAEPGIPLLARPAIRLAQALRFYSRLPVPRLPFEADPHAMPDFTAIAPAVPVAGTILSGIGALIGAAAVALGLSPGIAAALTLCTIVIITGCFHEDGLADACDGLWGGMTPERRLEIMRDSRVGAYGAAGLALSLLLRFAILSELFRLMGPYAAIAIAPIGGLSRALSLLPTRFLPPARTGGIAAATLMPGTAGLVAAVLIGALLFAAGMLWLGLPRALVVAILPAFLAVGLAIRLMRHKIGGFTGDLLGATQQVVEIALLLSVAAASAARGPM
ncbi:MAG: adenosylcobinamide-GDP ribazoletransferase [Methylobacterium sp.]|nr:MAG: adenosylcobinamide-GDP ribazoletransferase [Methylobacterium sp.]